MDRMTPPPNYYGPPFAGYNQNMPNNPSGNMHPPTPNMPHDQAMPNVNREDIMYGNTNPQMQGNQESLSLGYSYADIAHINRGKRVIVYCSFADSAQWHDMTIKGKIMYATDDHIALESDDDPTQYIVIIGVYINYMVFLDKPNVPQKKLTI